MQRRFLATALNVTKGLPDTVQVPAKAGKFTEESVPEIAIPDIAIEEWKVVFNGLTETVPAIKRINSIVIPTGIVSKTMPLESISSKFVQQQKFVKSNALLFRKSFHELLKQIESFTKGPIAVCMVWLIRWEKGKWKVNSVAPNCRPLESIWVDYSLYSQSFRIY